MFNLPRAMEHLNGQTLDLERLQKELQRIKQDNLSELSPEFGTREMLKLALQMGLLVEESPGVLRVRIPAVAA